MRQNTKQGLELRLQGLGDKSQGEMLEGVRGCLPDLMQLRSAWADLDDAQLYPPKVQDQERLRQAYEAYETYQRVIKGVESCLEQEVSRLEPALLMPEKELSKEVEQAERWYVLAQELHLTQVAYRLQVILEDVHIRQYLSNRVQKEEGVRLEVLHQRFGYLIGEMFKMHQESARKKGYAPLLEKAKKLKTEYEQIGCSIWGSYCGGLVKIVERRLGVKS